MKFQNLKITIDPENSRETLDILNTIPLSIFAECQSKTTAQLPTADVTILDKDSDVCFVIINIYLNKPKNEVDKFFSISTNTMLDQSNKKINQVIFIGHKRDTVILRYKNTEIHVFIHEQ